MIAIQGESTLLKGMMKKEENVVFLSILYLYQTFDLKFVVKFLQLPSTPNLSPIESKTAKVQGGSTLLGVATRPDDNEIMTSKQ